MQPVGAQQPISIEDKLSKPLDASIGAAWQPSMDPTLILQLPASPVGRSAALGRGHPAASRSHPVASRAPQHTAAAAHGHGSVDSSLGRNRSETAGTTAGQRPRDWGLARPDTGAAAQPSAVQRLGRPPSAGQEPRIRCCAGARHLTVLFAPCTPRCCDCRPRFNADQRFHAWHGGQAAGEKQRSSSGFHRGSIAAQAALGAGQAGAPPRQPIIGQQSAEQQQTASSACQ